MKAVLVMSFKHEASSVKHIRTRCYTVDNFCIIFPPSPYTRSCHSTIMMLFSHFLFVYFIHLNDFSALHGVSHTFNAIAILVLVKNGSAKRFILDCHEIRHRVPYIFVEQHFLFLLDLMLFKIISFIIRSSTETFAVLRISIIFSVFARRVEQSLKSTS